MKKIVALLTIGAMTCVSVTAFAFSEQIETITAQIRGDYTLELEGEPQKLADSSGDIIHPISYNGTTYLPIRAIGELFDKEVIWYGDTKSINLTEKAGTAEVTNISLVDLQNLVAEKNTLTWTDFMQYESTIVDGDLFTLEYPVDAAFWQEDDALTLTISGTDLNEMPSSIVLTHKGSGETLDLQTSDLCDFIDELATNTYVMVMAAKPVIYLYPEEEMDVSVNLEYNGDVFVTYPEYETGWNVTAMPDGTLYDKRDGKEYSYLFWEGTSDISYDMSKGFVVKSENTATFLQDTLAYLGLTPKEYNEFIVYWLPKMQENQYNLIAFQEETYTENALLEITPTPDSIQRVFMTYQGLDEAIDVTEQELQPFVREGFTVIEWGGTEIK